MDPIGASTTWRWYGYENSWVNIDGQMMQSVSGGGHWGGGMWISARDLARFGLLTLRRGRWKDKQIISEEWMKLALTLTPVQHPAVLFAQGVGQTKACRGQTDGRLPGGDQAQQHGHGSFL